MFICGREVPGCLSRRSAEATDILDVAGKNTKHVRRTHEASITLHLPQNLKTLGRGSPQTSPPRARAPNPHEKDAGTRFPPSLAPTRPKTLQPLRPPRWRRPAVHRNAADDSTGALQRESPRGNALGSKELTMKRLDTQGRLSASDEPGGQEVFHVRNFS